MIWNELNFYALLNTFFFVCCGDEGAHVKFSATFTQRLSRKN